MYTKNRIVKYLILSVVVAIVAGKTPPDAKGAKEVLFPGSSPVENDGQSLEDFEEVFEEFTNSSSSSEDEITVRRFQGNSATNFPGSNNNNYNPNDGSFLGNGGTNYPNNNNNNYIPTGSDGQGNGGVYYSDRDDSFQGNNGNYYPGNNIPNNNRPNNNRPNNNNRPINNGGNQFNPRQGTVVAFSSVRANSYTNQNGLNSRVRFENTITDIGYGWNKAESYFDCYYPGTYVFTWTAVSPRDSETRLSLFESGRETGHHLWSDRNGYQSASQTAVLNLNRNARVELRLTEGRSYEPSNTGRGYTTFSGFKLN